MKKVFLSLLDENENYDLFEKKFLLQSNLSVFIIFCNLVFHLSDESQFPSSQVNEGNEGMKALTMLIQVKTRKLVEFKKRKF